MAQTTWVRNSCELIGYCPELGQRLWGEIVDRMLRIDVSRRGIALSASYQLDALECSR